MIVILLIILIIVYFLLSKLGSSGTVTTTGRTSGDTTQFSISSIDNSNQAAISNQGFSALDIGGISLTVPNAVLQWRQLAEKYATINSILDPEEIQAIIWNESSGNPNAQNPNDPSWGLMGVTAPIGKAYASITNNQQLFDPDTNVKAGSGYLAHLKIRFGGDEGWSESYNEGETHYGNGQHFNPSYATNFNERVNALREYYA